MNRKLTIFTVLVVVICGPTFAADAPVDEVAALKAELASTKAELNKIKYANVPVIEQQIKQAPADWKDAYGDTEKTQVYFNIKLAWVDIENCKRALRLIASTINTITDPGDPNSLVSRIAVLETEKEQCVREVGFCPHPQCMIYGNAVMFTVTPECPGGFDIIGVEEYCSEHEPKALKPNDPNEVAK